MLTYRTHFAAFVRHSIAVYFLHIFICLASYHIGNLLLFLLTKNNEMIRKNFVVMGHVFQFRKSVCVFAYFVNNSDIG